MEVSALKYSGGIGLHGRSPLLRLQSDERLVALVRRGNMAAFEALVARYESRLASFCRHLLASREDAEDVLQEVLTAAFNAMIADERPINVRPWLYRIARNRSLNHLRRSQAIGVDSMDIHFSEHGASTADKAHEREEFRVLIGDIHELPETQKTALVLREMDALSYEQIAEAMETTIPSVKSLLVRARVSLAEAAEARLLSCEQVRLELGEVAEGLRRHLRACKRCATFKVQLKHTNKALAAVLPIGPLVVLKKLALAHLGHSAGSGAVGSGAGAAGSGAGATGAAAGTTASVGSTAVAGSAIVAAPSAGGFVSAGIAAVATKAAAGLAAAAIVTAGAVEVDHSSAGHARAHTPRAGSSLSEASVPPPNPPAARTPERGRSPVALTAAAQRKRDLKQVAPAKPAAPTVKLLAAVAAKPVATPVPTPAPMPAQPAQLSGHTVIQTDPTVCEPGPCPTTPIPGPQPVTPASLTTIVSGSSAAPIPGGPATTPLPPSTTSPAPAPSTNPVPPATSPVLPPRARRAAATGRGQRR